VENEPENEFISPKEVNEIDPPLTKRGIEQAKCTGVFLRSYFANYKMHFDKIVIRSSPFARTIMTANAIA